MINMSHARLVPPSAKYIANALMQVPSTLGSHSTWQGSVSDAINISIPTNSRIATGEHEAACKMVNTTWLTVTSAIQIYSVKAYVRLKPATRR